MYFYFKILFSSALIFFAVSANAQCPVIDYTVPTGICKEGNVIFEYSPGSNETFSWDFCDGSIINTPSAAGAGTLTNASSPFDISTTIENSLPISFVASSVNQKIFRLEYASGMNSPPVQYEVIQLIARPQGIEVYEESGVKYAVVTFQNSATQLLNFGSSYRNTPTVSVIADGFGDARHLSVLKSNGRVYIIIAGSVPGNGNAGVVYVLDMGSSITNTVQAQNSIAVGTFATGLTTINECGNWYVLMGGYLSGLHLLSYGTDLLSNPSVSNISLSTPLGMSSVMTNGTKQIMVATFGAGLMRVDFGNSMSNSPVINTLGNFGMLTLPVAFEVFKNESKYYGLAVNNDNNLISVFDFPKACDITNSFDGDPSPNVSYSVNGTFNVSLRVEYPSGVVSTVTKSVTVQNATAPDIDFSYLLGCVGSNTAFTSINVSGDIASYDWEFGDSGTSSGANPSHTYNSNSQFVTTLSILGNGPTSCANSVTKTLDVFNQPVTSFSFPSSVAYCTNQQLNFTNETTSDAGSNPVFEWQVNGVTQSTSVDFSYQFVSTSPVEIKLKTTVPGCGSEYANLFNSIFPGPIVDFTAPNGCAEAGILFSNASSGNITGYTWDFDNGQTSTQTSPTAIFTTKGNYDVSLTATTPEGCNSSKTKSITIYSLPQPDFSLDLPPFACSGSPSHLINNTPNPTDSNLATWVWNFGDPLNGTSNAKDPLYTFANAGDYDVSLTSTTNFNCSATTTKTITIVASPPVNFTNTPACLNQGTRFTDDSGSDIESWFWVIGNSTYSFSNPTHVFNSTGDQNVRLTVTGNNECIATLTKPINVPEPPSLDFTYSNACEGQPAIFQDSSPLAVDPVASQAWDFAGNKINGSPAQYSFSTAGTYAVTMTSTQQSGCSYSISKNVVISSSPVSKFSPNPELGTPPLDVQFTNQSEGATTFLWRFNDKNKSTSTAVSPAFQFTDLGDYVVDLVATNTQGCSTTASSKISVVVPSLDLELKDLNLIKDAGTGVYRIMVTIKNRSNFTLNSADVIVDISGNARIKETINATLLPDGEVSQLLTNQIIPGSLFTYLCAELDATDDLDEFNNKRCEVVDNETVVFDPYPNPSNGQFQFDWISLKAGDVHFSISNSTGQLVFQQDATTAEGGLNQAIFDLRSYNTGTYFFKFVSDSGSKTIPIVIVR